MKRVIAITLFLIFMSGQVNLTWAIHFCGSFEVENALSIGKTDLSCGMAEMSCCDKEHHPHTDTSITTGVCCSNDYYSSDSDDFFDKGASSTENQLVFDNLYDIPLLAYQPTHTTNFTTFISPAPPLQVDRQVLHQVFRL